MSLDWTPENKPNLPDFVKVELINRAGNPVMRFIVFEQVWYVNHHQQNAPARSVKDIIEIDLLGTPSNDRAIKKWFRGFVKYSEGEMLEFMSITGDTSVSDGGEPQVMISNIHLTDHTLAIAEFALRHVLKSFREKVLAKARHDAMMADQ